MRQFLIGELKKYNYTVHQLPVTEADLKDADEVFLTNAIYGIRWVKSFREVNYHAHTTTEIYNKILSTIYK
jgi:branched-chain amino acid aminotransferase